MRKLKPFLAAFILLAVIVLAIMLVTGAGAKKNTSYDGARFADSRIDLEAPDEESTDTVTAVRFSGTGRFV
ncbi:MAG: hypothetical protein K6F68_09490 [Clostridiales bacterium]|nr:hypothetical protein [Clostridiales bacterium]